MNRSRLAILMLAMGIMIGGMLAGTAPAEGKAQRTCPPCGMQLESKDIYADVEGYRIYTCSTYCRDKVKADPKKYIQKLRDSGEEPEKLAPEAGKPAMQKVVKQTVCPITGEPVKKDFYSEYKGQRVYFCCQGCVDRFDQNPEKYLKKMAAQGVRPEDVPAGETAPPSATAGSAGSVENAAPPAGACPMHGKMGEPKGGEPQAGEKADMGGKGCGHGKMERHHGDKAEGGCCCCRCCCCRGMKGGEGHPEKAPACPMKKMEGGEAKGESQPAPPAPDKK